MQTGNLLVLSYEFYSRADDVTVIAGGELAILLHKGSGWQYNFYKYYYPEYPITQDEAYLEEITQKYVHPLIPYGGILLQSWETASDIPADNLIDFCAYNNLLGMETDESGQYAEFSHRAPGTETEGAIQKYFDVTADYLRTSSRYNYVDETTNERYENDYVMLDSGGGGGTRALQTEQDGELLHIVVGIYGPDDAPNRPWATGNLVVKPEGYGFKYISYEFKL